MNVPSPRASEALREVEAILGRRSGTDWLTEVCRFLRRSFPQYRWVGVYRLEGSTLVLDGWDGPAATEHVRIPIGNGVCGRAAREGRTVLVDDVRAAPEYLACFLETRAEIVVPIRTADTVLGEIDVDGNEVRAFDGSDQLFLERVAEQLTGVLASGPAAGGPRGGAVGP